jgi:hypothetical protein
VLNLFFNPYLTLFDKLNIKANSSLQPDELAFGSAHD